MVDITWPIYPCYPFCDGPCLDCNSFSHSFYRPITQIAMPLPNAYRHPSVTEVQSFYGALLFQTEWYYRIQEHLTMIAKRLWWGMKDGNPAVRHEVSNYHPKYLGKPHEAFQNAKWELSDAQLVIAKEYGFSSWEAVEELGDEAYDDLFEYAVNYLLRGDEANLRKALEEKPELVTERSKYGHRATMLHYVASNGVEIWRQQVPENLPLLTQILLEHGADKEATMFAYGEEHTTLSLLQSSAHPFAAGVEAELLELLS